MSGGGKKERMENTCEGWSQPGPVHRESPRHLQRFLHFTIAHFRVPSGKLQPGAEYKDGWEQDLEQYNASNIKRVRIHISHNQGQATNKAERQQPLD
jgi:hypothetical protein